MVPTPSVEVPTDLPRELEDPLRDDPDVGIGIR